MEVVKDDILSFLRSHFPAGRLVGREYILGGIEGHAGRSFSINTETGVFADFSTGLTGSGLKALCRAMKMEQPKYTPSLIKKVTDPWKPLAVAKNKPASSKHPRFGKPHQYWIYRDRYSRTIGYVFRWNFSSGKQILPYCECQNTETGELQWRWKSFGKPRPLYGLQKLRGADDRMILLTEGEKAADAAQIIYPDTVAMSWPGGCNALQHVNWQPLAGRMGIIWPDNDEPGMKCAEDIVAILSKLGATFRVMSLPKGKPKGWDAADMLAESNPSENQAKSG